MTLQTLGRLTRVELRDIWESEASHFTPWLARVENLAILAEAIGLDLELEAQEKSVGSFRADILCKDIGTGTWVLIENQLERTDHTHLGQLLTYASGLEAVTIIWVAAKFTEEHRSTLDWLNKITDESFKFFGLEVELWRIGDSPAAPKFNAISKPNNWSRQVSQAAHAIDQVDLSETRSSQLAYWTQFNRALDKVKGPVPGSRKPQPQAWMAFSIGRAGFHVAAVMIRPKEQVRAELYIMGPNAKAFFNILAIRRLEIEAELSYSLDWDERQDRRDCRIAVYLKNADPDDERDWPRQHEWLAQRINELHRVFSKKVRDLDAETWRAERVSPGDDIA